MKFKFLAMGILTGAMFAGIWAVADLSRSPARESPAVVPKVPAGAEVIALGSGCFWRGGAIFQQVPGVISVTAGYMGGTTKSPTYEQVSGGGSGHTEVSRIVFDPQRTSLEKILAVFWAAHHPTSLNSRQARSVIFYQGSRQKEAAEKSRTEAAKGFAQPIVTEIEPAGEFYAAEEYHQDYYGVKKNGAASCGIVITPELRALGVGK